ncbi:hypothetical protein Ancab_027639 [Ancistrocladus abbreviatus]
MEEIGQGTGFVPPLSIYLSIYRKAAKIAIPIERVFGDSHHRSSEGRYGGLIVRESCNKPTSLRQLEVLKLEGRRRGASNKTSKQLTGRDAFWGHFANCVSLVGAVTVSTMMLAVGHSMCMKRTLSLRFHQSNLLRQQYMDLDRRSKPPLSVSGDSGPLALAKSNPNPPPAQSRNTTATTIGGESRSPTTSSCSPLSCPVDSTASIPPSGFGSEACGPSNSGSNGYDGVTKGKFTFAYYSDEEEVEEREDDDGLVEVEWDEGVVRGCWSDQETKVMDVMTGLRMEDMGWYKYQDLKVLDGSVVRLWEKGRERNLLLQ